MDLGIFETRLDRSLRRRMKAVHRHARLPQWELDTAINVVLFAGLGGACQGLEEAGCPVHVANNHDAVALAAHAAIHPHTRHVRGSIFDVDPIEATGGRPVKVLWASPDCRDHSNAKGAAPRSARVRSLPWQICRWVGKTRPRVIFMENVREIRGWGPLVAKRCPDTGRVIRSDGTVAARGERVPVREQMRVRDKRSLGRSFRAFVRHVRGLGYDYDDRDLCCADYGVPTSRRRWFAVARRDGQAIAWPAATHAPADLARALGMLPWVGAYTIIDWSLPIPSIFDRAKPLADATHRRIAVGLRRFVLDCPRPFILPITHTGPTGVHGLHEPLRTLTTAHRGEMALVSPALIQMGYGERQGQTPRVLNLKKPLGTVVAGGGKFGVVAAWMAQHNLDAVGVRADAPLSTLTTRGTQQQVTGAFLTHLRGTGTAHDARNPVPTLTAGGGHVAATAAFMVKYYGQGGVSQAADDALHTLTTKARFGVVTATIAGAPHVLADIGMRMLAPAEAAAAHELTLPPRILVDGIERHLTKTEAMRLVGNSVPKRMVRLIAQANAAHALNAPQRPR
jgi:DNA (cytosine-5)-methyltransferase 1